MKKPAIIAILALSAILLTKPLHAGPSGTAGYASILLGGFFSALDSLPGLALIAAGGLAVLSGYSMMICLDKDNTEGPGELNSPRMQSSGTSLSGGILIAPVFYLIGIDIRYSVALPLRNLEFGVAYRLSTMALYSINIARHDICGEFRLFPFHRLAKGVYFGSGLSTSVFSTVPGTSSITDLFQGGFNPSRAFYWNITTGYRIDLYPVFIQPEARFECDFSWNMDFTFKLEAGFYL